MKCRKLNIRIQVFIQTTTRDFDSRTRDRFAGGPYRVRIINYGKKLKKPSRRLMFQIENRFSARRNYKLPLGPTPKGEFAPIIEQKAKLYVLVVRITT